MSNIWFYEPFYDFERLLDDFPYPRLSHRGRELQRAEGEGAVRSLKPRMDLHEDNEKNLVTASFEFPGLSREDIQIDLHSGRLTVSAETKLSAEHQEGGYAVRERRFGKYARTLQLPQGVKEEEVKASMDHGILTVTFPKSTPELAPKRITVK